MTTATGRQTLLTAEGLTKRFDGVTVVDDVSFEIAAGEIVGLVGQNGSGKSTVIKMIAGFHRPDQGNVSFGGHHDSITDEADESDGQGVGFVHQDMALVADLSIVENLALGRGYPTRAGIRISWSEARREAAGLIEDFGIDAGPSTRVRDLSPSDSALLAIARGFATIAKHPHPVLILDEPTSSLADTEVRPILDAMRRIADGGAGLLFVSHHLDEVISVTDRILIMRDAELVAECETAGLGHDELVELMLGRPLEALLPTPPEPSTEREMLRVSGLSGRRLRNFELRVEPKEIVGITGLLGSGKSELGRFLAGAALPTSGEIEIEGRAVHFKSPRDAVRAGVGYVPPDRRTQGGIPNMTATENLTLPDLRAFIRRLGTLDKAREREETRAWMEEASVVPDTPGRLFSTFSGGNQQKLVYGRWIRLTPKILVLDEPTQGVDVGSVKDLYEIIRRQADAGMAILLLSSEWDDLARVCRRVLVLDRGALCAELSGVNLSGENIAAAAFGHGAARPDDRAQAEQDGKPPTPSSEG